ncbi:uncharacterized protein LOC123632096 [Lemur catta]|uniref:uncharacterized protein LOC123632096 n=1 Tax=Lemur catta TaxID=9447 RepID=UPI001E2691A3|nr:uncharacterized protein LOC123632096 [Lemur catta]
MRAGGRARRAFPGPGAAPLRVFPATCVGRGSGAPRAGRALHTCSGWEAGSDAPPEEVLLNLPSSPGSPAPKLSLPGSGGSSPERTWRSVGAWSYGIRCGFEVLPRPRCCFLGRSCARRPRQPQRWERPPRPPPRPPALGLRLQAPPPGSTSSAIAACVHRQGPSPHRQKHWSLSLRHSHRWGCSRPEALEQKRAGKGSLDSPVIYNYHRTVSQGEMGRRILRHFTSTRRASFFPVGKEGSHFPFYASIITLTVSFQSIFKLLLPYPLCPLFCLSRCDSYIPMEGYLDLELPPLFLHSCIPETCIKLIFCHPL